MDDATFNEMLQQFTDSGSAGHDPLRGWTAGLDDALNALPVVVTTQADSAPAPLSAVPNPLAMGAQAVIQQCATMSAATTYYRNDSSTAPPQMLQQTMTTQVPQPLEYDWAAQVALDMSYAGQATTAVYTTADAWSLPYGYPSCSSPPKMAQSTTFHDTAAVAQHPPPPPTVTHDYAAPTDDHQSTYLAATSYVGPVIEADAQSSAVSRQAPSHTQQTTAQRNSATPSALQDGPTRTKYRLIAPKPAPQSAATPSTSTAPSPGTPLFPAQAPRLVLAPYAGILRGAPPSELLDEAPMAASLAMLAPPAPARNTSMQTMAPAAKQPRQPTKKPRKLASASKQRGQPAPVAASQPVSAPVCSTPPGATAEPRSPRQASRLRAKEPAARSAPTTTPPDKHAAPEIGLTSDSVAALAQAPAPTVVFAGAASTQAGGEGQQRMPTAARAAEPASQRKRARPEAVSDSAPSTKRSVTNEAWHSRSTLDASTLSVPVGPRVQSDNNHISQQRSHALQAPPSQEKVAARSADSVRSDDPSGYGRPLSAIQPTPMQKTDAAALPVPSSAPSVSGWTGASASQAGRSSGTGMTSGSCPFTSGGAAQGSGAAAGPSEPQGMTTDKEEEDGGCRKKGNKKKKAKKLGAVNRSTNALGSLQAGLKWYSWMTPY